MIINERIKNIRKRKVIKGLIIAANSLFFTIIGAILLFVVVSNIDLHTGYRFPVFGYRTSVIVSESMAYVNPKNEYITEDMHQIKKNDLIITHQYSSYDDIQLYDVVTYSEGDTLICHRVIEKYIVDNKQIIVTRGDSNAVNDTPIEYSSVKGKVVGVIPSIGVVLLMLQSPYILIAVFGSLFFIFLAMFIISVGSYRKYDLVIGYDKTIKEDKTIIINAKAYDDSKSKKEYVLVGGDNHYELKVKGEKLVLIRYIRTDYKNKTDNIMVSGVFDHKELNETLILSVLPLAFDSMLYGSNPLKHIKKEIQYKGLFTENDNRYKEVNESVFSIIKDSKLTLDVSKATEEDRKQYKKLFKSYDIFNRHHSDIENTNLVYSYMFYCLKNDVDPMDLFKDKEVAYA